MLLSRYISSFLYFALFSRSRVSFFSAVLPLRAFSSNFPSCLEFLVSPLVYHFSFTASFRWAELQQRNAFVIVQKTFGTWLSYFIRKSSVICSNILSYLVAPITNEMHTERRIITNSYINLRFPFKTSDLSKASLLQFIIASGPFASALWGRLGGVVTAKLPFQHSEWFGHRLL